MNIPNRLLSGLKRALGQFLAVPLLVAVGFVVMTALVYWADTAWSSGRTPAGFSWLGAMLGDSGALATLLATIASSIITVTSITFSLLLIAIQQGSSALTAQVIDQFLMRTSNQVFLGYFVGLSIFVLLSLVTASSIHRPVFGATIIVVLTIVALGLIIVLIYNTIDQMRPTQIVRAIHRHILASRDREKTLLAMTRRQPRAGWHVVDTLRSPETGHIVSIDVSRLREQIAGIGCGEVEVQLHVPRGEFLAFGDPMATIRSPTAERPSPDSLQRLRDAVLGTVEFKDARDLRDDSSFGLTQLRTIAWTSASTAKSNPAPALAVTQSLRDIIARWSPDGDVSGDAQSLVVMGDAAPSEAIAALEDIILVASESIQAQTLASALRTLSVLYATVPPPWQAKLVEVTRRALSSLGEHVLTCELQQALGEVVAALDTCGLRTVSAEVQAATDTLATSVGVLNSRSTRVPAG